MKPLIVTALLALAAPQAHAGDVKVDFGFGIRTKGLHIDLDLFRHRDHPRVTHRRHHRHHRPHRYRCHREWVPGYYETVRRRVWVPGHFEYVHPRKHRGSARHVAHRERDRRAVPVRHYRHRHRGPRRIWVPGHYEFHSERVWHPGHWRRICDIPGHRH
jgi:hypothetical protein